MKAIVFIEIFNKVTKEEIENDGVTKLFVEKQTKAAFEKIVSCAIGEDAEYTVTASVEFEDDYHDKTQTN